MDGRDLFGAVIRIMGFAAMLYPVTAAGSIAALALSKLLIIALVNLLPMFLIGLAVLYWAENIVAFTYRRSPPRH
jgi:hypothetical protein